MLLFESMREFLKQVPVLRSFVKWVRKVLKPKVKPYSFIRHEFTPTDTEAEVSKKSVLNVLNYTKTSGEAYAATQYEAGYHKIAVGG